jgi:hypothetical protein
MKIISVKYLEDYKLEVVFSGGEMRIADFEEFITKSKHPSINKFADKVKFSKVEIDSGFLSWNNGEMELSALSVFNQFSFIEEVV